jgi:MFS transporter, ACS family, D-galactonate transporter
MMSSRERRLLALLFILSFLNYIDRANLSVGATDIQRDLHVSSSQLGLLLSGFFWTYSLLQLANISGWIVDRFHVGWILAGGFFLWSAATAFTGVAQTFTVLFAMRLVLGIGESIAYPAYSRILATYFAEHQRGLANALIDAGTKIGPAFGTLLGGLLMARFGWRIFFVALGAGTMLWLIPWFAWMPRGKGVSVQQDSGEGPSALEIYRNRSAIFSAVGLFCSNYFWIFLLTWLPAYLETERHFAKDKMAVFAALAFLVVGISTTLSGWLSDRLIARGATPTRVRKSFAGLGLAFSTIILPVAVVRSPSVALGLLMVTCFCYGVFSSNLWAITQTLAGPRAAGKWTGVQNGVGNLGGIVAPWLTGWVVQQSGQFYLAFLAAAIVALAGAAAFVFGIGPIQQVEFKPRAARIAATQE